jgi:hypothetical protein
LTVTPVGDAVDALNAEAGQLPVADPIPITYGHPLAGWTHVVDAAGKTIAAVNVNKYGLPARVTLIVRVPLGVAPVVVTKDAVTVQSWQSGFVPISFL